MPVPDTGIKESLVFWLQHSSGTDLLLIQFADTIRPTFFVD